MESPPVYPGDNENNNQGSNHRRRWSPQESDDRKQGVSDAMGSNRASRWNESARPHKAR